MSKGLEFMLQAFLYWKKLDRDREGLIYYE